MSTAKANIPRTYVIALLALGFLCSPSHQWQVGVEGNFGVAPNDGYTCSYKECRKPGGGPRLFQVRCESGGNTYGCIYRGNPHNCGNTYNGNAENFYDHLATKSGNNRPNGCSYWKLWHDNCPDAEFERVVNNKDAAPDWCDY